MAYIPYDASYVTSMIPIHCLWPGGGASQRKSCVASSSAKIGKDPYHVECIDENNTLSIHYPYTEISPIHTKQWTFKTKHPFHTFYEMGRFNPPFCVYTLPHNFAISNPPFHTQIWTSWLLHFFLNPPPRETNPLKPLDIFCVGVALAPPPWGTF